MILRLAVAVGGAALVVIVIDAAVRTFLLPRSVQVKFNAIVQRLVTRVFDFLARNQDSYEWRDRLLAIRPPISLLSYQALSLTLVFFGFAGMFRGFSDVPWRDAIAYSGSALFTIGFSTPEGAPLILVFLEAFIGLTLMALLISYLPTIYAAFQKREFMVSKLAVRTGESGQPWRAIIVAHLTGSLPLLDQSFWGEWDNWFIDVAESHTSLAILSFYRSPNPRLHWVSAARTILDVAALRVAVVDVPGGMGPNLTIRTGSIALRTLAQHFQFDHDPDPAPGDPISITREQFDAACSAMELYGVPLKPDRDAAWVAFAGWRVNYDAIIEEAASALFTPPSPWTMVAEPVEGLGPPVSASPDPA